MVSFSELIKTIITSPAFSFITAGVGFLIGNRLAHGRDRIQEFNKAAAAFHAEFADAIFHLQQIVDLVPGQKKGMFQIINTHNLAQYEKAVILFKPFLNNDEVALRFNNTWADYKRYMKATEEQYADYENPADTSLTRHVIVHNEKRPHEYLKHIDKLLSYAKRK